MRDSSAARGQCNVEFECASVGGRGRIAVLTGSKYRLALMDFGDPRLESLEDWSLRKFGYGSPGLPETARPNLRRARVEQISLNKLSGATWPVSAPESSGPLPRCGVHGSASLVESASCSR